MTVHRGFGATIYAGIESSWATAVARTNALRCYSASLMRDRVTESVGHLGDIAQVSTMEKHNYVKQDFAGGSLRFPVAYNDSSILLLRYLLGSVTEGGGAGTFTHALSLSSPLPAGLTIEQISGTAGSGAGNNAEVFDGCKVAGGTLSWEAGGILTAELDIIARTSAGLAAAGSPTLNYVTEWVKHNHAGNFTFNGVARPFQSMKLTIARDLQRNQEHGSHFTQEPYEVQLSAMLEVTTLWQQQNWDTEYLADTQADGSLAWTGTTSPNALAMAFHNAKVMKVSRAVSGRGAIAQTISMKLFADLPASGDQGFLLTFTNGNALYSAN